MSRSSSTRCARAAEPRHTGGAPDNAVGDLLNWMGDSIEQTPDAITDRHEEIARVATIIAGALGVLALGTLGWHRGRRALSRRTIAVALALAVGVSGLMAYTGYTGGQVRHTEVRLGGVAAGPAVDSSDEGR